MTFIKIKDFDLASLKLRWDEGDKFAFVEAIAYCAARGRDYPDWVRERIDSAMTELFHATFPDVDLEKHRSPALAYQLDRKADDPGRDERFKKARARAISELCLQVYHEPIIRTRKHAIRNICLAEMVAQFADFQLRPEPKFKGVTRVKKALANALALTPAKLIEAQKNDDVLERDLNGHLLWAKEVPLECCGATFPVIDNAWDKYKDNLLEERVFQVTEDRARQEEEWRLEREDKRRH